MFVHLVVDRGDIALVWDEDGIDDVDVAVVALDVHGLDKGRGFLSTPDVGLRERKKVSGERDEKGLCVRQTRRAFV